MISLQFCLLDFNLLYLISLSLLFEYFIIMRCKKKEDQWWSGNFVERQREAILGLGLADSKTTVGDTVPLLWCTAMFFRFASYYYLDLPFHLLLSLRFFFHYSFSSSIFSYVFCHDSFFFQLEAFIFNFFV